MFRFLFLMVGVPALGVLSGCTDDSPASPSPVDTHAPPSDTLDLVSEEDAPSTDTSRPLPSESDASVDTSEGRDAETSDASPEPEDAPSSEDADTSPAPSPDTQEDAAVPEYGELTIHLGPEITFEGDSREVLVTAHKLRIKGCPPGGGARWLV